MPPVQLSAVSLKSLRCARVAADQGSLTAAAHVLSRTQSALSKSLGDLERQLGVTLFDRFAHGLAATMHGRLLVARVREAEAQLALAARAHHATLRSPARQRHNPVFTLELSRRRLDAFLAVHELRDVGRAAVRLGLSRAAVYDSLRLLENLLEVPLFEHGSSALRGTAFADDLATHLSLAFSLLQHGLDEVASLDGAIRGRLVIGTLPYSRTQLVPRAIHRLLEQHPQLQVATREGPYDALERAVRGGTIDLIVGATRRHGADSGLFAEELFEDELAVICRAQHPLARRSTVTVEEMLAYGWVLPARATPARELFDRFLARHGVTEPAQVIETGSLSLARGLLRESNRLALLSAHQVQLDQDAGLLATLPISLEETFRPIGITRCSGSAPSPSARVFMAALRELTAQQATARS